MCPSPLLPLFRHHYSLLRHHYYHHYYLIVSTSSVLAEEKKEECPNYNVINTKTYSISKYYFSSYKGTMLVAVSIKDLAPDSKEDPSDFDKEAVSFISQIMFPGLEY